MLLWGQLVAAGAIVGPLTEIGFDRTCDGFEFAQFQTLQLSQHQAPGQAVQGRGLDRAGQVARR
mgnify:CR=1 FL=1